MNAAEQSMKILGGPRSRRIWRSRVELGGNSAAGADWGRSGRAAGGARTSAVRRGILRAFHDFRYEPGVGAREYLPGRSGMTWKIGDRHCRRLFLTDAYPEVFHGKISFISPALDPTTRTLQARIVVENKGEKLKKDMILHRQCDGGARFKMRLLWPYRTRRCCATTRTNRSCTW